MIRKAFLAGACLGALSLLFACAHQPTAKPEAPPSAVKPTPVPAPPTAKADVPDQPKQSPAPPPPRTIQVPQLRVKALPGWVPVMNRYPVLVIKHQKTEGIIIFRMVPTLQLGPPADQCRKAQAQLKKNGWVSRVWVAKDEKSCRFSLKQKYTPKGKKRPVTLRGFISIQVSPQVPLVSTIMIGTWKSQYHRQMSQDFKKYRLEHQVVLVKMKANSRSEKEVDRLR
jgi:hypothetical protein